MWQKCIREREREYVCFIVSESQCYCLEDFKIPIMNILVNFLSWLRWNTWEKQLKRGAILLFIILVIVFRGSRPLSVASVAFRSVVGKNITHGDESRVEVTVLQLRKQEAKIKNQGRKKERARNKVSPSVACPSTRPGITSCNMKGSACLWYLSRPVSHSQQAPRKSHKRSL